MAGSITYRTNPQNQAAAFWGAFREAYPKLYETDIVVWNLCKELDRNGAVEIWGDARARFDAFVAGLPGWGTGPANARTPLILAG
jgi:hypothetical protein